MKAPVDVVLAALADPTRRTIVTWLAEGRTPTATQLAGELPMSRQAVVKHLAVLRDAGLVDAEPQGRETRYRLRAEGLDAVHAWLDEVGAAWERRLGALKAAAESHHHPGRPPG